MQRSASGGKPSQHEEDEYIALLPHSDRAPTAVLLATGSNLGGQTLAGAGAGGRVQATMLDLRPGAAAPPGAHTVVTGIPMDPMDPAAAMPGTLVFMPDLPSAVQMWHNQRLMMVVWLISSLVSLVLFAPLFYASGLFLAAEIAAVLGVIASVVALCERSLAASNTLELGAQMKLVSSCGTVACFLDAFTVGLDLLLMWRMQCDPDDSICMAVTRYALVSALSCLHHGTISWVVCNRAHSLMPLLNPVTSGAVQL